MTASLRFLSTVQVLCMLAAVVWNTEGVGAFRPPCTIGAFSSSCAAKISRQGLSSSLASSLPSSVPPPARDTGNTSESTTVSAPSLSSPTSPLPYKVVNASALVSGPAHSSALEQASKGTTNGLSPSPRTTAKTRLRNNNIQTKHSADLSSTTVNIQTMEDKRSEAPTTRATTTRRTKLTTGTIQKGPVPITESMEQLLSAMDGHGDSSHPSGLTLILFHAHYCKICQRATMQLVKASKEYPSVGFRKAESRIVPEPVADNLRLLGVTKFPFVQIYRGGNCVASFSTGPTHLFMRKVRETLDMCLGRDEDSWEAFSNEFATEIEANRDARRKLQKLEELLP